MKIGDRVEHYDFGKGIIIGSYENDGFTVRFDTAHIWLHNGKEQGGDFSDNYPFNRYHCYWCDPSQLSLLKD